MSMDPRVLSQLLRTQFLGTSSWWNAEDSSSSQGEGDLFSSMLQSLLGGDGLDAGTAGLPDTIPAEYATYPVGLNSLLPASGLNEPSLDATGYSRYPYPSASVALERLTRMGSSSGLTSSGSYDPIIAEAAGKYQVPMPLIKAVIDQESSFQPYAVSSAGAKGLMQLMDSTAKGLGVTDSFDPEQNIHGGARYLSDLLKRYGGDEAMALAAYNAGSGRLDRLGITNRAELAAKYRSLPQETQSYVTSVLGKRSRYEA